jgi:hypothetical protein
MQNDADHVCLGQCRSMDKRDFHTLQEYKVVDLAYQERLVAVTGTVSSTLPSELCFFLKSWSNEQKILPRKSRYPVARPRTKHAKVWFPRAHVSASPQRVSV